MEDTGLFISVKDANTPVWRVRFSKNQQDEARLQRQWMEIFKQVVNEEQATSNQMKKSKSSLTSYMSTPPISLLSSFHQQPWLELLREPFMF